MKSPIDGLLDAAQWEEIGPTFDRTGPDELYATHKGILRIENLEFICYRLNNGMRVIDEESLGKIFGPMWEALKTNTSVDPVRFKK